MITNKQTLDALVRIPESDWIKIRQKCLNDYGLRRKIFALTGQMRSLGQEAMSFDDYFNDAVVALYEGIWQWKQEKYTIDQQIIVVMKSKMGETIRKGQDSGTHFTDIDDPTVLVHSIEDDGDDELDEGEIVKQHEALMAVWEENTELRGIIDLSFKGIKRAQIAKELSIKESDVTNKLKQIKRKAREQYKKMNAY